MSICTGQLVTTPIGHVAMERNSQQTTPDNTSITTGEMSQINVLEKEIELLKKIIEEKDEHNKSSYFNLTTTS